MINFEDFYNKKFNEFHRYAYNFIKKEDVSKDITQESFLKLNEKSHLIESGKHENWLRKVVKNKCMDYYRNKKRREVPLSEIVKDRFMFSEEFIYDKSDEFSDILVRFQEIENEYKIKEDYTKVMECVEKLSPIYKVVFIMFVIENRTHKEIADELGIVEGTSKSNYHKAKGQLRKMLEND